MQKRHASCRYHILCHNMQRVGRDEDRLRPRRLKRARLMHKRSGNRIPPPGGHLRGERAKLDGGEYQPRGSKPAQPRRHALVEQAVIHRAALPAHATDDAEFADHTSPLPFASMMSPVLPLKSGRIISLCALPEGIIGKQFSSFATKQSKITGPG